MVSSLTHWVLGPSRGRTAQGLQSMRQVAGVGRGGEGELRQWAKRLFPGRMWSDVYLSSHQGHRLARLGRGWHTAFPSSHRCQTTSVPTWRTFSAWALGLPGDAQLSRNASSPGSGRPDMVHPGPSLSVRLPSILRWQHHGSGLVLPWPCRPGKRMSTIKWVCVWDAMRSSGEPAGLQMWMEPLVAVVQKSDSITGSVTWTRTIHASLKESKLNQGSCPTLRKLCVQWKNREAEATPRVSKKRKAQIYGSPLSNALRALLCVLCTDLPPLASSGLSCFIDLLPPFSTGFFFTSSILLHYVYI